MKPKRWPWTLIAHWLIEQTRTEVEAEMTNELDAIKKQAFLEGYARGHADGRTEATRQYMRAAYKTNAYTDPN